MKQRIEYLDALRGLTILLVVYSHIVVLLMNTTSVTNNFFIIFRMPLFFFISGFLSYAVYDKQLMLKRIKNRFLKQLLPTAVVYFLYMGIYRLPAIADLFHADKMGYWFTLTVVEFFLTYMVFTAVFKLTKASITVQTIFYVVLLAASTWYACVIDSEAINSSDLNQLFGVYYYFFYAPFFFIGILMRMHFDKVGRVLGNGYVVGALIVLFIASYWHMNPTTLFLRRIVGILVVFRIFQYYGHTFSTKTRVGSVLSYVGRYTLEIYLLHYIIIRSMRSIREAMDWSVIDASWLIQFLTYFTFAVIITALCLLIARVIRVSPPLYRLMFGQLKD